MRWAGEISGLCALLMMCVVANAQPVLGRQVIASAAVNGESASLRISSTAGEPAYQLKNSADLHLKEGFQQGENLSLFEPLTIDVFVSYGTCWSGDNAALNITSQGCGALENLTVLASTSNEEANPEQLAEGTYNVLVVTDEGCTETAVVTVAVPGLPPCDLDIYNLVTPNGDGNNDHWHIGNISLPEYRENTVKVFNRWGNKVWEGRNYDNTEVAFTGRDLNNRPLPEGTYFYEVTLQGRSFTGYLTLLQ